MGKLIKPERRQIEGAWFKDRWKEGEENWEDVRAKQDHPEDVLDGLSRLRPAPNPRAPIPMELLDRESNIGRTVTLTGASDFQDILNLEADDKKSKMVTFHTIAAQEFGIVGAGDFLAGRVLWGAGGVQASAEFDWLIGTSFSLAGSFMRLQVRSTAALPAGATIKAGAFCGYGSNSGNRELAPQLSVPGGAVVAAGAGVNIAIPSFAKSVWVTRTIAGALGVPPAMRISQRPTLFVATEANPEQYAAGVPMERAMPIVSGNPFLRMTNLSVANCLFTAIFNLSI